MKKKRKYNRVLLKLSGEALTGNTGFGIDPKVLDRIAAEVGQLVELGVQIGMVIGGGNLFRGARLHAGGMERVTGDHMGMLATVLNSLALQHALEKLNVGTRVMSAISVDQICEPYIRRRAVRHLEKKRVCIFAAGTGNPYFTTDTAATLRATEMNCEAIFKGTNVDGIYDKDPNISKDAVKYDEVTYDQILQQNLKVMDASAVALARDNKIPIVVFSLKNFGNMKDVIQGNGKFTIVSPSI